MRPMRQGLLLCCLLLAPLGGQVAPPAYGFTTMEPLNGCSFYKPRLVAHFAGCAEFSAVRGRRGCHKVKGTCPFCVTYPGDDVEMWLPDYFVEVTRHTGRSVFAESADGQSLAAQLALGVKWRDAATKAPTVPGASGGTELPSEHASFWQARILTVPYGAEATNFPPLAASKGTGLPVCFSAISEFLPAQWDFNLADAPYAVAWAPLGSAMCRSIIGGGATAGIEEAKRQVGKVTAGAGRMPSLPADTSCANPVGLQEAVAKNARPTADTVAPLTDLARLCMGTWGNLVPRTGWVQSEDPLMSALIAAYKFQSVAADLHLNDALKLQADDKWQIVYPPRLGGVCFRPGTPMPAALLGEDDPEVRARDEFAPGSSLKGHTYVIAVWRRRESCEEPTEPAWTTSYRANLAKNQALCQAVGSL